MTGRLYGRGRVVEFVRAALRRQGVPDRPVPVVLLSGPRGSGGTALLDRIWTECGPDCLKVQTDLADAESVEDAVLMTMAGLLNRVPGIRSIRFPRLALAVKALTYLDDEGGRSGFDGYMRGSRRYAAAQSRLDDWAGRVSPLLSGPEQQLLAITAAKTLGSVLDGLSRHQEKTVLSWFAHQGRPNGGSGYDPLWDLRAARHDPSPAARRQVDKTLCAALLADLRTDFNEGRLLHGQRTSNPLLLLDNADSKAGRGLLELLTESRRENHQEDGPADPAVIVAVRRGLLTSAVGRPVASTDERLVYPPVRLAPPDTDHPMWWCPVRLTDLRPDDVAELCRSSVLGSVRRDADFLHGLTGGHPAATASLVVLLERLGRDRFEAYDLLDAPLPDPADLPRDWPDQDTASMTVRDHLVRRVMPDFLATGSDMPAGPVVLRDHPLLSTMAVCAATPGVSEGAGRAALQYLRRTDADTSAHERLTSALWLRPGADGGAPGLHPLAALLLRQLAARDTPRQWERIHTGYLTHYAHIADEPLRHLHQLALVDNPQQRNLTTVTGYLDRCVSGRPTRDWLALLDQVTAAPNRVRSTSSREAVVTRLAGAAASGDRSRVIARLAVARWLFGDRSFDPAHGLAKVIADEYDHLAGLTDGDSEPLYQESRRYRRIQREWEN